MLTPWLALGFLVTLADVDRTISSSELVPFEPVAIETRLIHGPVSIDLTGASTGRQYAVIIGSLDVSEVASSVRVQRSLTRDPRALAIATPRDNAGRRELAQTQRRLMKHRRELEQPGRPDHVAARIPLSRSFHLFIREHDFLDGDGYREIHGQLMGTGKHCLVYVDEQDVDLAHLKETVADIINTFDEEVFPPSQRRFGRHRDVDRDGRFTILLTHWLGKLCDGKVSVGGFVRGADFHDDVLPPFGNRCDMMYLNSSLRAGAHLRTILAHEYVHAITFSEHLFGQYLPGQTPDDEESWLSEATAHLAENYARFGWSNLDYRISDFLSAPQRYRLVVPDYYRAGLWRCHGSRGSTYLFLRWCVDQAGEELLNELTRSSLAGVENLQVALDESFEELFRRWCVAVCFDGMDPSDRKQGIDSIDLRDRLETRLLAGPRPMILDHRSKTFSLASTAFAPISLNVDADTSITLTIDSSLGENLQVTVVRLPDDLPRVELTASMDEKAGMTVSLRHLSGRAVQWTHASAESTSHREGTASNGVVHWSALELFGSKQSTSGQVLRGNAIPHEDLSAKESVLKALGVDEVGRRVAAWATIKPLGAAVVER